MGRRIVYQVINFTREEMFFGTTELQLEKEIERIAKDPEGPAKEWAQGDVVHWRPLTGLIEEGTAESVHKELESRPKPNNFRVILRCSSDDDAQEA